MGMESWADEQTEDKELWEKVGGARQQSTRPRDRLRLAD